MQSYKLPRVRFDPLGADVITKEQILEATDLWDTTMAGTLEHEGAAAKVVALVQSYFWEETMDNKQESDKQI